MIDWKSVLRIARLLVLLIVLLGLAFYVQSHAQEFRVIQLIDAQVVLIVWALHVTTFLLMALLLHRTLQRFDLDISLWSWVHVYSTSRLLGILAPQAASAYRVGQLKLTYGFPISSYLAGMAVFTFFTRILTLLFCIGTILIVQPGLRLAGVLVIPLLLAAALGCVAVAAVAIVLQQRFQSAIKRVLSRFRVRPSVVNEMVFVLRKPAALLSAFGITFVAFVLSLISHQLIFLSIGAETTYSQIAVLRLMRAVLDVFPLTPGNLGIAEVAYGALSDGMQVSATAGVIVSGVISLITIGTIITVFGASSVLSIGWRRNARLREGRNPHTGSGA